MEEKNGKKTIFLDVSCVKKKQCTKGLTSTKNGRLNISTTSDLLKDVLLQDLHPEDLESIQYHLKACYKPYILWS